MPIAERGYRETSTAKIVSTTPAKKFPTRKAVTEVRARKSTRLAENMETKSNNATPRRAPRSESQGRQPTIRKQNTPAKSKFASKELEKSLKVFKKDEWSSSSSDDSEGSDFEDDVLVQEDVSDDETSSNESKMDEDEAMEVDGGLSSNDEEKENRRQTRSASRISNLQRATDVKNHRITPSSSKAARNLASLSIADSCSRPKTTKPNETPTGCSIRPTRSRSNSISQYQKTPERNTRSVKVFPESDDDYSDELGDDYETVNEKVANAQRSQKRAPFTPIVDEEKRKGIRINSKNSEAISAVKRKAIALVNLARELDEPTNKATPRVKRTNKAAQETVTPLVIKGTKTPGGTWHHKTMKGVKKTVECVGQQPRVPPIMIRNGKIVNTQPRTAAETLRDLATKLHLSEIPENLPCREKETQELTKFLRGQIDPKKGESGAIYISGTTGTGKTSTVRTVIEALRSECNSRFVYVEVNAMIFRKKVFSEIYNGISEKYQMSNLRSTSVNISSATARQRLNTALKTADKKRPPIIILVDELDGLCNKKQDVLYDIFDWTTLPESRVTIIGIANTLDLPERMLCQRISSRLDKRRLIFQPYEFEQIEQIIDNRLNGCNDVISSDAIKLVSRKVASVSGDLRQALDLLRRAIRCAIEKNSSQLTYDHVLMAQKAAAEPFRIRLVKGLRLHELYFFRAVVAEIVECEKSQQEDWTTFAKVYTTYRTLFSSLEGRQPVSDCQAHILMLNMAHSHLVNLSKCSGDIKVRLVMMTSDAEKCIKAALESQE